MTPNNFITVALDLTPGLHVFLGTIQAAQNQKWSREQIETRQEHKGARLARLMGAAETLAQGGNDHAVVSTLSLMLQEWAAWKACDCLLNQGGRRTLDPTSEAVQQGFLAEARRTSQGWLVELEAKALCGRDAREQAQRQLETDWEGRARYWQHEAASGLVQQRESWKDAHTFAQAWADTALDAVRAAQQGVQTNAAMREPYEQRRHMWGDRLFKSIMALFWIGVGFIGFWWVLFEITTHIFPHH